MFGRVNNSCNGDSAKDDVVHLSSKASRRQILRVARRLRDRQKLLNNPPFSEMSNSRRPREDSDGGSVRGCSNQHRSDDNTDNASSVASPEQTAVSTMIMALESLSVKGSGTVASDEARPATVIDGTPIRSNLSWERGEDGDYNVVHKEARSNVRAQSNDDPDKPKSSPTRVRFQQGSTPKRYVDRLKESARQLAAAKDRKACEEAELSDSEVNVVSKHEEAIKVAMKKKTHRSRKEQKSREHAPATRRNSKRKSRRENLSANQSVDDDTSAHSEPTNDTVEESYRSRRRQRERRSEDFLDAFLDLVSFDLLDEEATQYPFTDDEETLLSQESGFARRTKQTVGSAYSCTDDEKSTKSNERLHDACNTLELPDTGKVFSDISSALSFKEDGASCQPMRGTTEAGKRVMSDISTVLSFGNDTNPNNSKDTKQKDANQDGYIPEISYTCDMGGVFPQNAHKSQNIGAPSEDVPVDRVSSAQLTYISELSSLAQQVATPADLSATMIQVSRSFEESKKVLESIGSPLSFPGQGQRPAQASPPRTESDDYDLELEVANNEESSNKNKRRSAKSPFSISSPKTHFDMETETSVNPLVYSIRSVAQSPAPSKTSTMGTEEERHSLEGSRNSESTEGSIRKILEKSKEIMKNMSPKRNADVQREKESSHAQNPLEDVLNSFQSIVTCGPSPSRKAGNNSENRDILTKLSESLSFWGKDTYENPQGTEKAACSPITSNTSTPTPGETENPEDDGTWEKMGRSFPKTVLGEEKIKEEDDEGSECCIEKNVTVTIHAIELSSDEASSPSTPDRVMNRNDKEASTHIHDKPAEFGNPFSSEMTAGPRETKDFAKFEKSFPPPPSSPQYSMPRRSPGKTVQSLQKSGADLARLTQSWQHPVSGSVAEESSIKRCLSQQPISNNRPLTMYSQHKTPIKAVPVALSPPRIQRDGDSPTFPLSPEPTEPEDPLELSKLAWGENELVHSPTWPNADPDTTGESWQVFQSGDVFTEAWSKDSPFAFETTEQMESATEGASADADPFQVTYQNKNAKFRMQSKSILNEHDDSPDTVMRYGESEPEFRTFGRRSLIQALSGTTQGEF